MSFAIPLPPSRRHCTHLSVSLLHPSHLYTLRLILLTVLHKCIVLVEHHEHHPTTPSTSSRLAAPKEIARPRASILWSRGNGCRAPYYCVTVFCSLLHQVAMSEPSSLASKGWATA